MKKLVYIITSTLVIFILSCTESFLDYTPKGKINSDMLNTPENIDKLVTAAYSALGNDDWPQPMSHMWQWGSVRSDDAYKGGGSVPDQGEIDIMEQFVLLTTSLNKPNLGWINLYEGIGRCNDALSRISNLTEAQYPNKAIRTAECRFLRGHFYFLLKVLFKYPVWVDETVPREEIKKMTNRELTNDQLWEKIAEDFKYAADNLPIKQSQVGRASKTAAWAYLAKVRLYQAYEQDEQNNVTQINTARLQEVVKLCDSVINSGKHELSKDFAENFLREYENGKESIFAIQFSVDDGTLHGRLNKATGLNYNMAPQFGCCDFHNPSQNLVNAFKTDANGLPMFDTFNDVSMKDSIDFRTNGVDPRLDHTVGIVSHPFKYDPEWIMQKNWRRAPHVYGYYSPMKEIVHYKDPSFRKYGAFHASALNFDVIRYADVLLWKAEALIELGRQAEALPLINEVRTRAANSTSRLKYSDGLPVSNYRISTYQDGVNCIWTQDFARKALQFERRLEFATESPRFFDLVRWGIAAETLNSYFAVEKTRYSFLIAAYFKKNRDEYLPIPQQQIDLVEGIYTQNYGW
ncbi:MAG TPA: RagB/SusD family nutrient uptake outer membrane protein [Bacteroidales bacterium]|nr:RagB/SusD family nutrient uptake outer membrane protein [Bacteroidales bacterium]HQG36219.1 RagB/SusD family nutrient uptake outer membrane protein [Bacteroidales bacterium]HQG53529.1 RagB/SusD family nutrient uptake outer membrane protein [Bacteroidales bacterium]HRC88878.1 RagB/SusD family nutrient uptake outer membrane protein [Bacteroidales bacterium]